MKSLFKIRKSKKTIPISSVGQFLEENSSLLKDTFDFSYMDLHSKAIKELGILGKEMERIRSQKKSVESARISFVKRLANFIASSSLPEVLDPDSMTLFLNESLTRISMYRESSRQYREILVEGYERILVDIDSRFDEIHGLLVRLKADILSLPSRRIKRIMNLKENILSSVSEAEFINQDINLNHQKLSEVLKEKEALDLRMQIMKRTYPEIGRMLQGMDNDSTRKASILRSASSREFREYYELEYKMEHLDSKITKMNEKKAELEEKRSGLLDVQAGLKELGNMLTDLTGIPVLVAL